MNEKLISAPDCDFDIQDLDIFLQAVEKSKKEFNKYKKKNKLCFTLFMVSNFLWLVIFLSGHISVSFYFAIPAIFFLMACIITSPSWNDYPYVDELYKRISAMINRVQELQANPDIAKDLAYVMKFDLDEQIFEITCFYKNESIPDGHFLIPLDGMYFYEFYEGSKIRIEGKFDDDVYIVNAYLPTKYQRLQELISQRL